MINYDYITKENIEEHETLDLEKQQPRSQRIFSL